ncbi:type II and III secretion system protein family protein [Pinisolibacter sp.]|uniref:type II and III secretion system protein family protein n=1 Tax=Pinisolibacter sp. TaxID=2172024 RepID=UPI002FDE3D5D
MFTSLVSLRSGLAAALVAVGLGFAGSGTLAAEGGAISRVEVDAGRDRVVQLPLSKSRILDFDEDIRDVLVSDPKVADAVVRSARRLYLIGNKFGTTNIIVFGAAGRPIANLELQVQVDTRALEGLLKRLLPKSEIRVEAVAGTVVLSGMVASSGEAIQAYEVASKFVGAPIESGSSGSGGAAAASSGGSSTAGSSIQVVNALTIRGKDQVMLRVTIAEVQRDIVKKLGIDLTSAITNGNWATTLATSNPFPITPAVDPAFVGAGKLSFGAGNSISGRLSALEQNGLLKTLAEPNLSALSGEQAQFLVGGEYPIPVSQTSSGTSGTSIGVEFKTYGIGLNFQPVVLDENRISLTVKTEVSELTSDGAVTISTLTIPALRVRRASTTLEIPSGGAMVLGGLIKDDVKQALAGTPGLLKLPILGSLFRSRDFQRSQSELVIFVQPLVVRPVAAAKLERPDRNFQPSSDAAGYFLGRLNRMYRTVDRGQRGTYHGQYGYIFE